MPGEFGDVTFGHDTRVVPDGPEAPGDYWRAVCSCGWRGPLRVVRQGAAIDAVIHAHDLGEHPRDDGRPH